MAREKKPKPIAFTDHAIAQMTSRSIRPNQVTAVVRQPDSSHPAGSDYATRLERDFPPNKRLIVIAEETSTEIRIVTTFWGRS